jgi:hypothetical protein
MGPPDHWVRRGAKVLELNCLQHSHNITRYSDPASAYRDPCFQYKIVLGTCFGEGRKSLIDMTGCLDRGKKQAITINYWLRDGRGRREAPTLQGLSNYSQDHPGSHDQTGHVISTGCDKENFKERKESRRIYESTEKREISLWSQ